MKNGTFKWFLLLCCLINLSRPGVCLGSKPYMVGIIRSPGIYALQIRDGFQAEFGALINNVVYLDEEGFAEEEFGQMNVAIAEKIHPGKS